MTGQPVCSRCAPEYNFNSGDCTPNTQQHLIELIVDSHIVNRCDDILMKIKDVDNVSQIKWHFTIKDDQVDYDLRERKKELSLYFEG